MAGYGDPGSFQPGVAVNPSTQVEISVSCKNLKDTDVFSKSDPMVVLFQKDVASDGFYELGRTEMIKNCLNPDFVKKFVVNYFFEESQRLKFQVYDIDSSSIRLDQHDYLGAYECTVGELVGCLNGKAEGTLQKGNGIKTGTIILRAEEVGTCKEVATLHFKANNLDKKDFFGKSDPYLTFHRCNEDGSYTIVYKTEVIKKTLNPTWKPFQIPVQKLCNGDYDRSIKVMCYDWDSDGGHDFIGECSTNLRELSRGPSGHNVRELINKKKQAKKRSYKNSGVLGLLQCTLEIEHSFLDYIRGGMEMNFTVAIDFTASNGNPAQATSLHYTSPYQPNQYSMAIQAVGEIIQDYDTDKLFPVLGFGARLPPDGTVSHEFFVNGHASNPYCQGVSGVLQAYQQSIRSVQLYGPTNFAPVIRHVSRFASSYTDGSHYFVLLIITDGIISDMPQTLEAIVQASRLPMSIIIVGVGKADFTAMNILDGDDVRVSSNGITAERDIVQFVPFREFMSEREAIGQQVLQARLAKEVLAEVPAQVLGYMKQRGIQPRSSPAQHTALATAPSL